MKNKDEIIINAKQYVKEKLNQDCSGHDFWHALRVWNMAKMIAENEEVDLLSVELVALLHDLDDKKISPDTHQNKDNARKFLESVDFDKEKIDKICDYIGKISFNDNKNDKVHDKVVMCVRDADRLDAMGAIGIARAFSYGGNKNRPMYIPDCDENNQENSSSIQHFYDKLFLLKDGMYTEIAKKMAEERDLLMREFVRQFLVEWNMN